MTLRDNFDLGGPTTEPNVVGCAMEWRHTAAAVAAAAGRRTNGRGFTKPRRSLIITCLEYTRCHTYIVLPTRSGRRERRRREPRHHFQGVVATFSAAIDALDTNLATLEAAAAAE